MNVSAAALRYLKRHGRPVTVDGAPGYIEWGKPVDAQVGIMRVPGRKALCSLPVAPGARIDDGPDVYGVTEATTAPDGTTIEVVPLAARATVSRSAESTNTVSGITGHVDGPVATGVPCCVHTRKASLTEGEGHWTGNMEYHLLFLTEAIEPGDEVEVSGAPRLKAGVPARPDGQPLWHVPATAISAVEQPGTEV